MISKVLLYIIILILGGYILYIMGASIIHTICDCLI
jgi:hypothetical protein